MIKYLSMIGEQTIQISVPSAKYIKIQKLFNSINSTNQLTNIKVKIKFGYGESFTDYQVSIKKDANKITFRRSDYLIESTPDYTSATIHVHDELALKHALMNLYSSYIVYHNWGLLIHSSCVIEDGRAHIFAGHSGAGKSTAARLSEPRNLLSDEATIVKISEGEITIYDSPFRSELQSTGYQQPRPLSGIQLLHQADRNILEKVRKPDALLSLMDKVFYWSHDPAETQRIMGLLRTLVERVPVYELYFRKDPTFWELIS
ncbi:hypothetical protein G3A_12960 [Bacillus sp. 17376]|uniref:Uncharacterized protein n=1 Tax=Mesobacillus boroniphilus JCM 21738 TaxID=1294265 RepID=W4RIR5_9BACI|nr:hypothetical protein [Mesobacillus boroniphilus]ESU32040.1 hypothetical protein G3A_12960 [Bacillus sp. 17376]GAE44201.1 hypothetical protein JCM21738_888 [Mesobacillus boroniphilus JCM 21738]